ncbi:MAG: hypothetical protein SNJ82_08435 [Gemmataceae bacterium]
MWFGIEVIMAVVGVILVLTGKIPVGGQTVRNPIATLTGMVLASALPLSVTLLVVLSFREVYLMQEVVAPEEAYRGALETYWWVYPVSVFSALSLAGGLIWLGLQQEQELPPLVNETINPEAMRQRAAEVVATHHDHLAQEPICSRIPNEEDLPPEVKTYTAPPEQIPEEIAALGQAECVFASQETLWWGRKPTSYALFRQGLVILHGDDFTLIPFSAMQQLEGQTLCLTDGSRQLLNARVEHHAHLLQLIQQRLMSRATANV